MRADPLPSELRIEMTSGLIRNGSRVLVHLDRDWTGEDRWRVYVDRALPASDYVPEQIVEPWEKALDTGRRMATDVAAHEEQHEQAAGRLVAAWPRRAERGTDDLRA